MISLARILEKVKVADNGCWEWNGFRDQHGYGVLNHQPGGRKTTVRTHRAVWQYVNGPIKAELCVLHRCDNPPCCNPAHLFLGTLLDNIKDRNQKGRSAKGEGIAGSILSADQVIEIRRRYQPFICTAKQLADEFHVAEPTIRGIIYKRKWRHLLSAEKDAICL